MTTLSGERAPYFKLKKMIAVVYWIRKIKAVQTAKLILSSTQSGRQLTL